MAVLQMGCTSTVSVVPDSEKAQTALEVGDKVTIHLKNGAQKVESVASMDNRGIGAQSGVFYRWSDIAHIETSSVSAARSAVAVMGIVALLAIIAIALFASSAETLGD